MRISAMVYLVSYDLNADTGNYAAVYEVIKSFGAQNFTQCLESSWLISTTKSAKEVFEILQTALNKGDRCFISRVDASGYCSRRMPDQGNEIHIPYNRYTCRNR